jgi:hypothetical protein
MQRTMAGVLAVSLAAAGHVALAGGGNSPATSCSDLLLAKDELPGLNHQSCRSIETDLTYLGAPYRRVDIGITGTIDGMTAKDGPRTNYFTQSPEFVFAQTGNKAPLHHGVGLFKAEEGSALIVVYPTAAGAWNGRMFLTAHGAGASFRHGTLKPWDQNLNPADPLAGLDKYERLMIEKGFAVAKTRRSTHKDDGDVAVTLDDGTVVMRNVTEQPRLILGFGLVAAHLLKARLGRSPEHMFWYGHSSGARPGRLTNYHEGVNRDKTGKPIVDGILADDSGAGLFLPVLYKDGRDVLFGTDADRARFVKQIDISHMFYVNATDDDPPPWASTDYLSNKRSNAKILRDKGLGPKHRVYEVLGVSHSGGEDNIKGGRRGDVETIDLSRLMDTFIDLLDSWVVKNVDPPPSMSDWAAIGDVNKDGVVENPAIALPEIACPLGVYFQYPPSQKMDGVGTTSFVPFDGQGLEPLDGRGVFVDMNLNRYRDRRETLTEAWRRLGLIGPKESFTRERYSACVASVVDKLRARRLLSARVAQAYKNESSRAQQQ